jgi:hypothetical protein
MKKYIDFNPKRTWPTKPSYYYECGLCGSVIPSQPADNVECSCGNFMIDVGACRIRAINEEAMKLFEEVPA